MRLREMHVILKANIPRLQAKHKDTGGNQGLLTNRQSLEEGLWAIGEIPYFREEAHELLQHELMHPDTSLVVLATATSFVNTVKEFRSRVSAVRAGNDHEARSAAEPRRFGG